MVVVDLEDIDVRYGWIFEIRVEQQGGTEVGPLPVQPMMYHTLGSSDLHGFLSSIDITQEISSGDRREICH